MSQPNNNDLPTIRYANGDQLWCQDGLRHRDNDLPAFVAANGDQEWYHHGKRHRGNDLPAIICANGDQLWYQHGTKFTPAKIAAVKLRVATRKYHTLAIVRTMRTYLPREMAQIILQFIY